MYFRGDTIRDLPKPRLTDDIEDTSKIHRTPLMESTFHILRKYMYANTSRVPQILHHSSIQYSTVKYCIDSGDDVLIYYAYLLIKYTN